MLIFAKGSLLCASKPADISITSGLNLSKFSIIVLLKISINSFDSVPAFIGALNILFFPFSSFEPVPGKSGD